MDVEKRFFDEPLPGNGVFEIFVIAKFATNRDTTSTVPVIAVFMKFDDLIKQVYNKNVDMVENRRVALAELEAKFQVPLSKFKYPPKAYLRLESAFNFIGFFIWLCKF